MTLAGKVALVAGATRGAGRGIALELAHAGAVVYCTGRSTRAEARPAKGEAFDLDRRPETIEETADLARALGGNAIPVRVDHTREAEVEALVARIAREAGRLDIVVNDIWGGDALVDWGKPLAETSLTRGFTMLERAVHTHLVTSRYALPLLRANDGLLVEVTDGEGMFYRGNVLYDLAKTSVIRLAFALAEEARALDAARLTVCAITPGFLRSEAMLDHFRVTEERWRDGIAEDPHFAFSETPRYVGRAIAALAADPERHRWAGRGLSSWGLQRVYGFTDVDGSAPHWGDHAASESFGADQAASDARFHAMFAR